MRLAEIANPKIATLYRFWERRRLPDGRPMPRAALDPGDLAALLPNLLLLQLVDPEAGPDGLRIRLAGDAIEQRYGRSLRGLPLGQTFGLVRRDDTSQQWSAVLRDARPKYRRGPMYFPDGRRFESERLILPLSGEASGVAFLLAGLFYLPLGPGAESHGTEAADLEP